MARRTLWKLRRGIRRPLRAQRGQAMIMMAVMLPILIMFVGLVADTGIVYVTKARLQNTVDAAALAGAHQLPTTSAAKDLACTYIIANKDQVPGMTGTTGGICATKATVTFEDSNTIIKVESMRNVPTVFGSLLGRPNTVVTARAKVKIGSVGRSCVFPFFVGDAVVKSKTPFVDRIFFTDNEATTAGGALNVENGGNGQGSRAVREAIQEAIASETCTRSIIRQAVGSTGTIVETIEIEPGAFSKFYDGFPEGMKAFEEAARSSPASSCPSSDLSNYVTQTGGVYNWKETFNTAACPRLVAIPVAEHTTYKNNVAFNVLGFVPVYIAGVCPSSGACPGGSELKAGEFWGYIVSLQVQSDTYTTYNSAYPSKVIVMSE